MSQSPNVGILVIEDQQADFELIKNYLKNAASIDWCQNGTLPDSYYDIYLIDNRMAQQLCALEMIDKIRKKDPSATIFIYSGQIDDSHTLKKLMNLGVDGFIDKNNINLEKLENTVSHVNKRKNHINSINERMAEMPTFTM